MLSLETRIRSIMWLDVRAFARVAHDFPHCEEFRPRPLDHYGSEAILIKTSSNARSESPRCGVAAEEFAMAATASDLISTERKVPRDSRWPRADPGGPVRWSRLALLACLAFPIGTRMTRFALARAEESAVVACRGTALTIAANTKYGFVYGSDRVRLYGAFQ